MLRRDAGSGSRLGLAGILVATALAGALIGGVFATQVIGGATNRTPEPGANPVIVPTVPATTAQAKAAGASLAGASATKRKGGPASRNRKPRKPKRVLVYRSQISQTPIVTEEGGGSYVGLQCPQGAKAVSGGVLSQRINLVISSSSPNKPDGTGQFTPNTWWLAVTNINVDGTGGSLAWRGVVTCLQPVKFQN